MKCSALECPHSATHGRTTCTAHRVFEDARAPAAIPESGRRRAMFLALVLAGAVLLVLAALELVKAQLANGGGLP